MPRISLNILKIKQQIKDPLYRNALFLMANTIVTSGLGFFFWMVVARFYSEADVGWGAAIVSAIGMLAMIGRMGLGFALIRFLPKAEKPVQMINACFTLSGVAALALAAIFIAGVDLWSPALGFIKENATFVVAFVFFVLFSTLTAVMESIFIAKRRADFILSKNTIFCLLKIALPFILVLFFRAFGIVSSWGIAVGIALVISLFLFLPRVQSRYKPVPNLNLGIIRSIWRYSAGNYLANLLLAVSPLILPIIIVNLLGAEQNAYFYVAWKIATLLFIIPVAVSQSLFAEGSHFEDQLGVNVRRSYRFAFLLLIPAIILILLLGKWLLLAFGATYSANALLLLQVLAISGIFVGINRVYYTYLRVRGRMRELVAICGFMALCVLLGSYLITPTTGIIGVGYAWLGAQGLVSVYIAFATRLRYIKE